MRPLGQGRRQLEGLGRPELAASGFGSAAEEPVPPAHRRLPPCFLPSALSVQPAAPSYFLNRKLSPSYRHTLSVHHHRSGQTGGGWLVVAPQLRSSVRGCSTWLRSGYAHAPASAGSMVTPRESLSRGREEGASSAVGPGISSWKRSPPAHPPLFLSAFLARVR